MWRLSRWSRGGSVAAAVPVPQSSCCWLLILLIIGQTVYAAASIIESSRLESTATQPQTIAPSSEHRVQQQQQHQQEFGNASSTTSDYRTAFAAAASTTTSTTTTTSSTAILSSSGEQHALTLARPPRGGRFKRQEEEEEIDRCRLFVEGSPNKNELYSPEYPNLYPKNINCTRVITAPKGQIIRLDFRNSFNIEAKEECKFDFLEIRDGQYGFSQLIGKFCGTDFPPEITSKERYLWLHFHSDDTIEYTGFSAVYEFLDRNRESPSTDLNCTIEKDGFEGFINSTDVPADIREQVIRDKIPLDCIWRIQVKDNWKIFLKFLTFQLSKPNDCETNFLDIFPEQTVMPLRVKNFCGSAGESITTESNILHMRFYAEQSAITSTFAILYTAFRDRGSGSCASDEYDCEDATCISQELMCNERDNCKFRWDEEKCKTETNGQSEHVVIIIIVFGLILGGMVITFIVNCIRKIIRDQKIIRDVPALRDSVYHIDSFVLDAPKSAIFVGLQNDFLCDFTYTRHKEQQQQQHALANNNNSNGNGSSHTHTHTNSNSSNSCSQRSSIDSSNNNSQMQLHSESNSNSFEMQQQVLPLGDDYDCDYDCDYDYDCVSSNALDNLCPYQQQQQQQPSAEEQQLQLQLQLRQDVEQPEEEEELDEEEEQAEEEAEEEEAEEEEEYDDGIGFSCDSDSATIAEDDEFVLVTGHCLPLASNNNHNNNNNNGNSNSNSNCSSSLQCSTPTGIDGCSSAAASSTTSDVDAILPDLTPPLPPPPPPPPPRHQQPQLTVKSMPKARKALKFFNKII
ncbi:uncharacterized protein LOC117578092 isoform X1 [Drosophila albomicans]|uniref:Uncharacterized protein LOC117578092 isoform X1 n=1 Tax=Drosophila albomicans TaxID=7291 RepID=A0A9C6SZI7_DROAB|nr:uncharacterized protein LOC117578092 isoform X1 [Drosophila albomicans]